MGPAHRCERYPDDPCITHWILDDLLFKEEAVQRVVDCRIWSDYYFGDLFAPELAFEIAT